MRLYQDKNGYWYYDVFRHSNRIRKSLKTRSLRMARKRLAELVQNDSSLSEDAQPDIEIRQFFQEYIENCQRRHTDKTLQSTLPRMNRLLQHLTECGVRFLSDIDRSVAKKLKDILWKRGLTNATVNRYVSHLKSAISYAIDVGYLNDSPIRAVRKEPEKSGNKYRIFSREEVQTLIENSPTKLYGYFIEALSLTGARMDEVRLLVSANVDLKKRLVTFEKTKNMEPRTIPINDRLCDIFSELMKPGQIYVFGNTEPAWNRNIASQTFRRISKRTGVQGSIKTLRATCVSRLIDEGVGLKTVMEYIGHKTARLALEVYAQVVSGSMRDAVEKL